MPRKARPDDVPQKATNLPEILRRYKITVEREFLSVHGIAVNTCTAFCPDCARQVDMLSPDMAAVVAGATGREIYRWVEEHRVHFVEPTPGGLLVCCDSLRKLTGFALQAPDLDDKQDGQGKEENK